MRRRTSGRALFGGHRLPGRRGSAGRPGPRPGRGVAESSGAGSAGPGGRGSAGDRAAGLGEGRSPGVCPAGGVATAPAGLGEGLLGEGRPAGAGQRGPAPPGPGTGCSCMGWSAARPSGWGRLWWGCGQGTLPSGVPGQCARPLGGRIARAEDAEHLVESVLSAENRSECFAGFKAPVS